MLRKAIIIPLYRQAIHGYPLVRMSNLYKKDEPNVQKVRADEQTGNDNKYDHTKDRSIRSLTF